MNCWYLQAKACQSTQINNAGEGGLYAELIQDRSFDALAATSGSGELALIDISQNLIHISDRQKPAQHSRDAPQRSRKLTEDNKQKLTSKHALGAMK